MSTIILYIDIDLPSIFSSHLRFVAKYLPTVGIDYGATRLFVDKREVRMLIGLALRSNCWLFRCLSTFSTQAAPRCSRMSGTSFTVTPTGCCSSWTSPGGRPSRSSQTGSQRSSSRWVDIDGLWLKRDTEGSLCFKPALNCTAPSPVVPFWIILEGFPILMRLCRM